MGASTASTLDTTFGDREEKSCYLQRQCRDVWDRELKAAVEERAAELVPQIARARFGAPEQVLVEVDRLRGSAACKRAEQLWRHRLASVWATARSWAYDELTEPERVGELVGEMRRFVQDTGAHDQLSERRCSSTVAEVTSIGNPAEQRTARRLRAERERWQGTGATAPESEKTCDIENAEQLSTIFASA